MTSALRIYTADECGADGYPLAWHSIDGGPGVKHLVRAEAGYRCIRCGHPYQKGDGEWSTCDADCRHGGPVRVADMPLPVGADEAFMVGEAVQWHISEGRTVEARWRILTVHHLRVGQEHKRDLRWWNLTALCQRCHLAIQGKVQMERVYPLEHSEWFKPYAAGWYAWSYLGLELSREETMARMDELLSLERIA